MPIKKKNKINDIVENIDTFDNTDEKNGLTDKLNIESPNSISFKPEPIDIVIDIEDEGYSDNPDILFSMKNKILLNTLKDYEEIRIRLKRNLESLEWVLNRLTNQILEAIDVPVKLYEAYSKIIYSFNSLADTIDKQNKEMVKKQLESFKHKVVLTKKEIDEAGSECLNDEDNIFKGKNLDFVMREIEKIEKITGVSKLQ